MTTDESSDNRKLEAMTETAKTALILTGGGARGAYQVGVLKAIADMHPKEAANPFRIISGTSAGALNAVALAASANNFRLAVKKVERLWTTLSVDHVIKSGGLDLAINVTQLFLSLFNRGIGQHRPVALLNNEPLRELLQRVVRFDNIQPRIDAGYLEALAVSATSYATGHSVSFFQGVEGHKRWHRANRIGVPATLTVDHLLASTAIPTVFPAQKVGREYFGDGSLRQLAPLSPALRLGADRLVVIGARGHSVSQLSTRRDHPPSLAQTFGHIFNSAFIDALEYDLDHAIRVNELLGVISNEAPNFEGDVPKAIDMLVIRPTIDFDALASEHLGDLPRTMRGVLRAMGAGNQSGGGNLASYVLFDARYCRALVEAGYADAMRQRFDIQEFFGFK